MRSLIVIVGIILFSTGVIAQPADIRLGVFFQPGITHHIISYENSEVKDALADQYANDKPDLGWESGISAQMFLSDLLHIESGVAISKKGYRSSLTIDSLILVEEPEDPMLTDLEERNSSHEFYFFTIPARLGINLYSDRNIMAGVRCGIQADYLFRSIIRYENIYYNRTENSVVHPDLNDCRKINLSGSFSIFCTYELSDQYDVSLEPYCSVSVLNISRDSKISTRFILAGIRVGIHRRF